MYNAEPDHRLQSQLACVAVAAFFLIMAGFARWIGADFQTTIQAVALSSVFFAIAGFAAFIADTTSNVWDLDRLLPWFGVALLVVWPCWHPVLDSIALGGKSPFGQQSSLDLPYHPQPLYVKAWFKWGFEAVLVAFAAFTVKRSWAGR
jgi:hypothetical protein